MSLETNGIALDPSLPGCTFAVLERELVDDEEEYLPRLFVRAVPSGTERPQVKEVLDKAGRVFGVSEGRRWINHTVVSFDRWPTSIRDYYLQQKGGDLTVTFDELEDEAKGEKRVTLRLSKAVHSRVSQRAAEFDLSFNEFCEVILEWAADNFDNSLLHAPDDERKLSQRNAMRALHRIFRGDKDDCIKGWIKLYREGVVAVGKHPERYPPDTYAPQLWKDGVNKNWLTDRVSDDVVEFVRPRVQ